MLKKLMLLVVILGVIVLSAAPATAAQARPASPARAHMLNHNANNSAHHAVKFAREKKMTAKKHHVSKKKK